jgi:4-hydroxy-3-methylbut-2-enyl diphosphate reductase
VTAAGLTVLAPLRTEWAATRLGARGLPGVRVVRTGAGAERARAVHFGAAGGAVAVLGVCGAVAPGLRPGQVVVADALLGYDGSTTVLDAVGAADLAAALTAAGVDARSGTIASTERLARGAAARRALAAAGALAVDLESAGLAGGRTDTVVVRAVVDTPEAELLSPATVTGGLRALAALRRAAPVVARWSAGRPPAGAPPAGPTSSPPKNKEDQAWECPCARA